jgi:recombination protein RecR
MKPPKPIQRAIEAFEKLPGVGSKTAQRLAYYLLHVPQENLSEFGEAVARLRQDTRVCALCFNISSEEMCPICSDPRRDSHIICVVEQPLDILAVEKSGVFKGKYHVLHGALNPLESIGPDQIHMHDLLPRLKNGVVVEEIIVATNPTMEGEATAVYIQKLVNEKYPSIQVTRIGRGLPTGADLEYADEVTLTRAFEGRREL